MKSIYSPPCGLFSEFQNGRTCKCFPSLSLNVKPLLWHARDVRLKKIPDSEKPPPSISVSYRAPRDVLRFVLSVKLNIAAKNKNKLNKKMNKLKDGAHAILSLLWSKLHLPVMRHTSTTNQMVSERIE